MDHGTIVILIAIIGQSIILLGILWKTSGWATRVDLTLSDYLAHKAEDVKFHENTISDLQEIKVILAGKANHR